MKREWYALPAALQVATLSHDTILNSTKAPDLIKVDIEGAEHYLFRGAKRALRFVRPVWFVEVAEANSAELSRAFEEQRYRIFDGDVLDKGLIEGKIYNWLAIPDEKLPLYRARIDAARCTVS
jgi:hypothetical protein